MDEMKQTSQTKLTFSSRSRKCIEENLEQILVEIDQLFKMRLIQNLIRPVEDCVKLFIIGRFAIKMKAIHNSLSNIRDQIDCKKEQSQQTKNWGILSKHVKQKIKEVKKRYIDLFYEGSFKNYKKIMNINNFESPLPTVNIFTWQSSCLSGVKLQSNQCC